MAATHYLIMCENYNTEFQVMTYNCVFLQSCHSYCLSYFSHLCDKILWQIQLNGERGQCVSQHKEYHSEKSKQQHVLTNHETESNECSLVLSPLSLLTHSRIAVREWCHAQQVGFCTSIKPNNMIYYKYALKSICQVILDPVKLVVNIDQYSYFSHYCDKILSKNNLKRKVLLLIIIIINWLIVRGGTVYHGKKGMLSGPGRSWTY